MLRRLGLSVALLLFVIGAAPPPDVTLTDERGRTVRFHSDLSKGRTVAVNFIFTSCITICSPMSGTFARVETLLDGRDARLISVTLDPVTDTPARLAEWKKKFGGRDAWTLLSGTKEEIDKLAKALGVFTPDRVTHTPMVVVFNDVTGRMTRVNGLGKAQAILDAIDSVTPTAVERGRALYERGPAAEALVGDTVLTVPMACSGCHGSDGRGRTEGGVSAPDITWQALSRPSAARRRETYDTKRLVRAMTMGIDSSGRALAAPMPRYRLTRSDADALASFLRGLGTYPVPGLTDDAIRIGVVAPEPLRAPVVAWAEEVNRRGGLYARRIEIRAGAEDVFVVLATGGMASEAPLVPLGDPLRTVRLVEETLRKAGGGLTRDTFLSTLQSLQRKEAAP